MAKVVHFTTVHPVVDTRIFARECRSLAASGHDVTLIAVHTTDELIGAVHIKALPGASTRLRRMTTLMWRAYRAALAEKADIYHFHDPELIPAGLLLKVHGKRVIYDVHEDVPLQILVNQTLPLLARRPLALGARVCEQLAAWCLDGIVAATPPIALKFPKRKTETIHNFPDAHEFGDVPTPTLSGRCVFVYVGAVSTIRGANVMVDAANVLTRSHPDAQLRVLGPVRPPGLLKSLQQRAQGAVSFEGWAGRQQVREALSDAKAGLVVLQPVPNYLDSYPVKLFEYMSAGLPVIASAFPVWRRIIDGAHCGLLVDPTDPQEIAEAMRWIIENPSEARAMGERGRHAIRARFNWANESHKLIRFYDRLLA